MKRREGIGETYYRTPLIAEFNRAAKEPIGFPRYPYVDEYPTFISWPFVWLLARYSKTGPELIALLGFFARLFIGCIIAISGFQTPTALLFLLCFSILSDCADGQMARYRNCVSSLGALYDLTSDFIGSFVIFFALSLRISSDPSIGSYSYLMGAVALCCYFCSCTVWSYVRFRAKHEQEGESVSRQKFLSLPLNDHRTEGHYQWKYRVFRSFFNKSWLLFARVVVALPLWKRKVRTPRLLHIHALASLNIHWMVLFLMIGLGLKPILFLFYEVAFFMMLLCWIALTDIQELDE